MSFTKKSEKFIKGFVKEFENYCVKKSQATQTRTENILKIVFNDIKRAEHFVKLAEKKKENTHKCKGTQLITRITQNRIDG